MATCHTLRTTSNPRQLLLFQRLANLPTGTTLESRDSFGGLNRVGLRQCKLAIIVTNRYLVCNTLPEIAHANSRTTAVLHTAHPGGRRSTKGGHTHTDLLRAQLTKTRMSWRRLKKHRSLMLKKRRRRPRRQRRRRRNVKKSSTNVKRRDSSRLCRCSSRKPNPRLCRLKVHRRPMPKSHPRRIRLRSARQPHTSFHNTLTTLHTSSQILTIHSRRMTHITKSNINNSSQICKDKSECFNTRLLSRHRHQAR